MTHEEMCECWRQMHSRYLEWMSDLRFRVVMSDVLVNDPILQSVLNWYEEMWDRYGECDED